MENMDKVDSQNGLSIIAQFYHDYDVVRLPESVPETQDGLSIIAQFYHDYDVVRILEPQPQTQTQPLPQPQPELQLNIQENHSSTENFVVSYYLDKIKENNFNDHAMLTLADYYKNAMNNTYKMKKYLYMAVKKTKNIEAMMKLAQYFHLNIDIDYKNTIKMKKYYNMAIKYGNNENAMMKLANYYKSNRDYGEMKKYYSMIIDIHKNTPNAALAMHKMGVYYQTIKDYDNMKKYYLMAIELDHIDSMHELAQYYELVEKNNKLTEKYYLMAVELKDVVSMYNFADYYKTKLDFKNMEKYYWMAFENYQDIESMYELIHYYKSIQDNENIRKCLVKGIQIENVLKKNLHFKRIPLSLFKILEILKSVDNPCEKIKDKIKTIMTEKKIIVYENKIKLFTQLNHIVECPICYETKLNIDLNCAHCFCTDCYVEIFNKCCPLCRL